MDYKSKVILYSMLIVMCAFATVAIFNETEDVDGASIPTYTVPVGSSKSFDYSDQVPSGNVHIYDNSAVLTRYESGHWYEPVSGGYTVDNHEIYCDFDNTGLDPGTYVISIGAWNADTEQDDGFNAAYIYVPASTTYYTVTFAVNNSSYGSVSQSSLSVPSGSTISKSGNTVTINGQTVTATPASNTSSYTYSFSSWSNATGTVTANKTITANFTRSSVTPTTYTCYLYYDANNGSGAPSTQSYTGTSTSSHSFTISSTQPTRSGYTFLGWAESQTATSASYQPGGSISVSYNGSKTLYAVWQITGTLNFTVGTYGSQTIAPLSTLISGSVPGMTIEVNSQHQLQPLVIYGTPTTAGTYTIKSYNSTNHYVTSTTVTVSSPTYTVDFVARTGGSVSPTSASSTSTTDTFSCTATPSAGYYFDRWVDGNGDTFSTNPTITGNIYDHRGETLYAEFHENVRRVSIGSGSGSATATCGGQTVTATSSTWQTITTTSTASATYTATPATGYSFSGWEADGGNIESTSNPYTVSGSYGIISLKAIFVQDTTFTVTFAVNNSSYGSVSPASVTNIPSGTSITVSDYVIGINGTVVTATPTASTSTDRYAFDHWSGVPTSGTVTSNITITANFTHSGGGVMLNAKDVFNNGGPYEYPAGTYVTISAVAEYEPVTTYWGADPSIITVPGQTVVTKTTQSGTETKIVYFNAPGVTTYTVTFNTSPSGYGTISMASIGNIPSGSTITTSGNTITINRNTATATPAADTSQYTYSFSNWSGVPTSGTVTSNITITANFTRSQLYTHTLEYNANGGILPPATQTDTSTNYSYTFTISNREPHREYYEFLGWADTSTATTATYQPGGTVTVSGTTTKTLYAVWAATIHWHVQTKDAASQQVRYTIAVSGFGTKVDTTNLYDDYRTRATTSGLSASVTMASGYGFSEWKIGVYDTSSTFIQTVSGGTNESAISWSNMPTLQPGYIYNIYVDFHTALDLEIDLSAVNGHATVSYNGSTISTSHVYHLPYGTSYTLSISNIDSGYYFDQWYIEYPDRADTDSYRSQTFSSILTEHTIIQPQLTQTPEPNYYDITFVANDSSYGYISPQRLSNILEGTVISVSNNILTINGTNVGAYGMPRTPQYSYTFDHWSGIPSDYEVNSNLTITANFTRTINQYDLDIDLSGLNGHATVSYNGTPMTSSHVYSLDYGTSYTLSISNVDPAYPFKDWYIVYPDSAEEDWIDTPTYTATIYEDTDITPELSQTFTVTFASTPEGYGTTSMERIVNVPSGSTIATDGNTITINEQTVTAIPTPATDDHRYYFDAWTNNTGTVTADRTITAIFHQTSTGNVTVQQGGTFKVDTGAEMAYQVIVYNGDIRYYISSASVSLEDGRYIYTITIDQDTPLGEYWIAFAGMPGSVMLNDYTINVTEAPPDWVWWDNGYINGSVEIAFNWTGRADSPTHEMTIPLWEYVGGPIDLNGDPHGLRQFQQTAYSLKITNGYNQNITLKVMNNGQQVGQTYSYKTGYWEQYALIIDAQSGSVTFKGIHNIMDSGTSRFTFVNYKPVMETKIFDFSGIAKGLAIGKVYHNETGSGEAPRFQVSGATTYLNTFGFVMVDPELNIYDKFPNYDNLRLNFYSFAYYGESVTINGHTMDMSGFDIINVYYIPKGTPIGPEGQRVYTTENIISNADDPLAKHAEIALQNIYVTWNNLKSATESDRVCYLTFVDGGLTINMGTYNTGDLTVSMDGVWWFTTMLYEPYVATENTYEMDWNSWFNLDANAFIILFMVIAGGIFILMNRIYKPGFLDYAVVIGAGLLSYIMLGGGY